MSGDGFIETYRGAVGAAECDVFGHLNIAFYPERFAAAALDLLERAAPDARWRTIALRSQYLAELRAGEGIVIRSAVLEARGGTVRLAHQALTPAGTVTTRAEHDLVRADLQAQPLVLSAAATAWERFPEIALPAGKVQLSTGRDRVRASETEAGTLSLEGHVRRFSDACLFVVDAIGMTDGYRRDANRGFATFETALSLESPGAAAGDGVIVDSGIVAFGTSSLRMLHRMRRARDGSALAQFYQAGVHFDLAARRSAPWPAEFRARAESLRIAPE